MTGVVKAVCRSAEYTFSKPEVRAIRLLASLGVEDDVHAGLTVKHRSRAKQDPTQPNLRQVHLIHVELHEELRAKGFAVFPGAMGENITTQGIDLLALPTNTCLHIGESAVVQVTGLRNPCYQLNDFQAGLMPAVLDRDAEGNLIRKSGIMAIVLASGVVRATDSIRVELPAEPHRPLEMV